MDRQPQYLIISIQSVVYNALTNTFVGLNVSIVWESGNQREPFEKGLFERYQEMLTSVLIMLLYSPGLPPHTFTNIDTPQDVHKGFSTFAVGAMLTEDSTIITLIGLENGSCHLDYFYNNGTQHLATKMFRPSHYTAIGFCSTHWKLMIKSSQQGTMR
eukprot:TRINITY_DN3290_c0_g1_i1.p1 TRINITY_DN3290_c0_g1~~TRINITY_DN3290_c0_g1_i1.p1  ORF type:complete len:158 (+),score=10.52 TRINITY_DN3290_c0_g1_i1:259-732(+)